MRILTARQPWAWAIIHAGKTVENRPRNIAGAYRGPVAIHAGKAFDDAAWDDRTFGPILDELVQRGPEVNFETGAIIGIADLVDVHPLRAVAHVTTATAEPRLEVSCCESKWAQAAGHHLVFANPRPLVTPMPYTGALGLRHLDAETIVRIQAAIV